jgi:hypothetical protein
VRNAEREQYSGVGYFRDELLPETGKTLKGKETAGKVVGCGGDFAKDRLWCDETLERNERLGEDGPTGCASIPGRKDGAKTS